MTTVTGYMFLGLVVVEDPGLLHCLIVEFLLQNDSGYPGGATRIGNVGGNSKTRDGGSHHVTYESCHIV